MAPLAPPGYAYVSDVPVGLHKQRCDKNLCCRAPVV